MAETFITQCPHCGTSFRVSDEQLSIANGSVRCGACLQVFSARNHIVTAAAAKAKSASRPEVTASKTARPAAKSPAPGQRATAPKAAAPKPKTTPPASKPKPARPAPPSRFAADDDDDADFLFEDNPEEDQEFVFQDSDDDLYDDDDSELGDLSDSFISLNNPSTGRKDANPFQREADDERDILDDPESADESWAESILEELEREESRDNRRQEKAHFVSKPTSEPRPATKQKDTRSEPAWSVDDSDDDFDAVDFGPSPRGTDDTASASSVVRQLNHDIDLDFNADDRLARWRWLGAVFIVLLVGILAAQLAWVQRDTYAKMEQWRDIYQSACDVLGCTLPEQEDIDLVRTSNVLIRDHRALDDVKLLDAVLTNRAAFRQPFPVLILQYTDVNGELVADQSFTPEQYLRGELTGTRLMPVNTRIYVSLPIRDPGSRAVNYQLVLAPA